MPWRVHLYSQHQRHEADKDSSQHSIEPRRWDNILNCRHLSLDMCKGDPSIHPPLIHPSTHLSFLSQISIFIWVPKYALPCALGLSGKVSGEEAHLLRKLQFHLHDNSFNTKLLCRNIYLLVGGLAYCWASDGLTIHGNSSVHSWGSIWEQQ